MNPEEKFSSDLIDLSEYNLAEVRDLPNAVLRAAVERVRAELADGTETVAFFQNSMQDPDRPDGKRQELAANAAGNGN